MIKKTTLMKAGTAALFALLGAYVANCVGKTTEPAAPVANLYAQTLNDAAGTSQALSQWKGKTLVVNFWAPWCGPCVKEMPELSSFAQERAGKVQVIGIGIDSPSNIAEFSAKFKIKYPIYVAGMAGTDLARQLGDVNGGLPFTVVIGADGQVKKTYLGTIKFDELKADLAALKG